MYGSTTHSSSGRLTPSKCCHKKLQQEDDKYRPDTYSCNTYNTGESTYVNSCENSFLPRNKNTTSLHPNDVTINFGLKGVQNGSGNGKNMSASKTKPQTKRSISKDIKAQLSLRFNEEEVSQIMRKITKYSTISTNA
jgi:hypothetical protein